MEVTFKFDVSGTAEQTVRIMTDDTPEQFFEKLKNGEYCTTLCTPYCQVLNLEGEQVGEIEDTEIQTHSRYNEWEQVIEETA